MIPQILLIFAIIISCLHYIPSQHWVFRSFEFAKIQLAIIQAIVLIGSLIYLDTFNILNLVLCGALTLLWMHNITILIQFTPLFPRESKKAKSSNEKISFLAVNVYQYNDKKHLLVDLVKSLKPDILLTIESDKDWEESLQKVEYLFQYNQKIPKDNTYGMHFYTSLKAKNIKVNYFVADDLPSIEADLISPEGQRFKFFGVHPPPPSPTEETTSKERDGEILLLGRTIKGLQEPCIVVGDFNNVAWSKSSKLFKKTTQLLDPRIGRGFISTFHAKYRFLRFPIDLVFHSDSIYIQKLKTEKPINSDHFPIYGEFIVDPEKNNQHTETNKPDNEESEEIDELIKEGKETDSDKRQ